MIKKFVLKAVSVVVGFCVVFMAVASGLAFVKAVVAPEEIGKALEYKIVFNNTLPQTIPATIFDVRSMNGYNAFSNIKVNNGDKLHYELYIPSTSNYFFGFGGIDGSTNATWALIRNSNPQDQNNNYLYSDVKDLYGSDKWIARDITLAGLPVNEGLAHIGPSVVTPSNSIASMAGQTAIVYYRNIKVIHADNSVSDIYVNGGFTSNDAMESNINGTLGTVSLKEVNVDGAQPEEIGRALEYKTIFNTDLSNATEDLADLRSINGLNAFSNITVNAGDKLVYDVYIPFDGNYVFGMGAMEGQFSPSEGLIIDDDPIDQNNNDMYTNLSVDYGTDKWITREIVLAASNQTFMNIGPSYVVIGDDIQSVAGETAIVYYRNIKIVHVNNTVDSIYVNGGFISGTDSFGSNIDEVLGTVSLTEVNKAVVDPEVDPEVEPEVEPEEVGRALEYKVEFNSTLPSNTPDTIVDVRSMNGYNAFSNIKVNNGDKLHYELYIPSTSNYFLGFGGIDGSTNVTWALLRNSNPKDQNNNILYSDQKTLYGTDKWISRDITLAGLPANEGLAHIGPSVVTPKDNITSMAGKTAIVYYRNIKVIHADNTSNDIYVNGGYASTDAMESNINGTLGTVSLNEVNKVVPQVEPEAVGRSLEYKVVFNSTLSASMPTTIFDVRSMNGYNAFENIKVNNGDKIHYELYIPSTSNYFLGLGGIDGSTNKTWALLRNSNPKDQNNNNLYSDQKTLYGTDKWISRDITLAGLPANEGLAHIGPSFVTPKENIASLAGKTAIVYFRNIKIIRADNSVINIYVNGGFVSGKDKMESNIAGTLGNVTLTEVNVGGLANVKTSDNTNNYLLLFVMSSALITIISLYRKKSKIKA